MRKLSSTALPNKLVDIRCHGTAPITILSKDTGSILLRAIRNGFGIRKSPNQDKKKTDQPNWLSLPSYLDRALFLRQIYEPKVHQAKILILEAWKSVRKRLPWTNRQGETWPQSRSQDISLTRSYGLQRIRPATMSHNWSRIKQKRNTHWATDHWSNNWFSKLLQISNWRRFNSRGWWSCRTC